MRIVLPSLLIIIVFVLSGCSQKLAQSVPNYSIYKIPPINTKHATVENLNGEGTIFKVSTKIKGKTKRLIELMIISTMRKAVEETKSRGYIYFQIISPSSISNANGFPINTIADLTTYLVPQTDNVPNGYNGMVNAIQTHSALDISMTVFGTSEFAVIVKIRKDPKYYDIVWDTKKY